MGCCSLELNTGRGLSYHLPVNVHIFMVFFLLGCVISLPYQRKYWDEKSRSEEVYWAIYIYIYPAILDYADEKPKSDKIGKLTY